jgi:hypothetical protein
MQGSRNSPDRPSNAANGATVGPIVAIVSLADQRIHVYGGDGLLAQSRVSTGTRDYRTPTGVFSVIQKRRYHESNIYSGAPMPWMQRITWSGIALHGGVVPGYPASHGCIRLTYDFAPRMWDMTKVGARVIVAPHGVEPVPIAHPRLPVPSMTSGAANVAGDRENMTPVAIEVAAGGQKQGQTDTSAGRPDITGIMIAPAQGLETPLRRARAKRAQAAADVRAAETAMKSAVAVARKASAQAQDARGGLRKAQKQVALDERRLAAASRVASKAAANPDAIERAAKDEEVARETLEVAQKDLADVAIAEAIQAQAARDAATVAKEAIAARDRASDSLKALGRALDPISVFVSRKEGRVFMRQGMAPLIDGAVTIRDPERSLGTHVFTALAEEEGGARLRWAVVTVSDSGSGQSAAEALDRIEISSDFGKEIANRLWTGASLIISDQGTSSETGLGTDFVVLTKP